MCLPYYPHFCDKISCFFFCYAAHPRPMSWVIILVACLLKYNKIKFVHYIHFQIITVLTLESFDKRECLYSYILIFAIYQYHYNFNQLSQLKQISSETFAFSLVNVYSVFSCCGRMTKIRAIHWWKDMLNPNFLFSFCLHTFVFHLWSPKLFAVMQMPESGEQLHCLQFSLSESTWVNLPLPKNALGFPRIPFVQRKELEKKIYLRISLNSICV